MAKPHVLGAAGAAALALGLAACGSGTIGSQQAAPPAQTPRAAVLASMAQVKTSSYRFTMRLDIAGLGHALAGLGGGTTGSGGAGAGGDFALHGSGAFSGAQRALQAQLSVGSAATVREILFFGTGTYYLSISALPGKWYELSASDPALGKLGSLFGSLGDGSPAGYIDTLKAVTGVRKVGTTTIGGTIVTHYAVTENLRAALDKVLSSGFASSLASSFGAGGALGGAAFSHALDQALKAMPPTLTFDVYVDPAGHLRRLAVSIPLGPMFSAMFQGLAGSLGEAAGGSGVSSVSGPTGGELEMLGHIFQGVHEDVTMDLSDYGAALHIAAPPASEVVKGVPSALGGSQSQSSSASTPTSMAAGS
jgi:hypothetical protein